VTEYIIQQTIPCDRKYETTKCPVTKNIIQQAYCHLTENIIHNEIPCERIYQTAD